MTVYCKGYPVRQKNGQEYSVQVRGVIGDNKNPIARFLVIIQTFDTDAVEPVKKPLQKSFDECHSYNLACFGFLGFVTSGRIQKQLIYRSPAVNRQP